MRRLPIAIDSDRIAASCRKHHIRRMSLYGSVLRDDFQPNSDVDVRVEFAPDHVHGLEFFAMQTGLSGLLGREVDLSTVASLNPHYRDEVLSEAQVQYVAP